MPSDLDGALAAVSIARWEHRRGRDGIVPRLAARVKIPSIASLRAGPSRAGQGVAALRFGYKRLRGERPRHVVDILYKIQMPRSTASGKIARFFSNMRK